MQTAAHDVEWKVRHLLALAIATPFRGERSAALDKAVSLFNAARLSNDSLRRELCHALGLDITTESIWWADRPKPKTQVEIHCPVCGRFVVRESTPGNIPIYCSDTCRLHAARQRKEQRQSERPQQQGSINFTTKDDRKTRTGGFTPHLAMLYGTPEQVRWATEIRAHLIDDLSHHIERTLVDIAKRLPLDRALPTDQVNCQIRDALLPVLWAPYTDIISCRAAAWWIHSRDTLSAEQLTREA